MFNRVRSLSFSSGELDSLIPDMDVEMLPTELRELYQSWSQSPDSLAKYSNSVAESDWPVSIYVPERYEERYAYPLVIWFHSDANDEDQLEQFRFARQRRPRADRAAFERGDGVRHSRRRLDRLMAQQTV